ncbi:phage tail protein [Cronobacter sakazakii]|uniref:Ig-like domain-containing protein n=2 Tax=Cronobacter sakazakii TaxID=28141 RepID=UPI00029BF175|nr:Ig-like domain-containing protein [Cronobacter sakazakii]CCJ98357.1 COG5492: Bacterial surface proteins containing Ig-like domains [Cronobacter malonaticus 507]EKK5196384.1 Ig domain-containing protein [Cronobacter sakazakii]ELY2486305.1 Ig domain-containing protein [Cronobacter sakazakii]ELY2764432.1 Ig domain-containing protein [Cronobacter sakazakii]ELY3988891.1 Ig domain-containing protein [Cronobacter sakazakii]
MTLDPTALSVAVGATSPIKASVTPENATNKALNWTSGDEAIATVDASGVVTGVAEGGPVDVTATAADGSGVSAFCAVTVTAEKRTKSK